MTEPITTRVGVLPPPVPPKSEIIPVGEYRAIVDATDVELVSQYVWYPERSRKQGTIYAMAHVRGSTRMIKCID